MPLLFTGVTALANAMPEMRALTFLDMSNNSLGEIVLPEGWTIGVGYDYLKSDEYRHADGRKQMNSPGKAEGIITIANAIRDMEAISSVNLLKNAIPLEQAQELVKIMQSKEKLITLCGLSKEETRLDFSNKEETWEHDLGDAVLIANDISDMRALTSLDISKNCLYAEGTKLLAEALKSNQIMTALNISSNFVTEGGMSGVVALADAIPDMVAISQFTFSGDGRGNMPVTMEISMTEADFSAKGLGQSGAIMVAAFLPKCT
jgi:hypothetical protein